jgi:hypothetical protein
MPESNFGGMESSIFTETDLHRLPEVTASAHFDMKLDFCIYNILLHTNLGFRNLISILFEDRGC